MAREYWRGGNMLYPLPAVMISCGRKNENPNIMTVAWTGTVCSDPAMLFISVRKERFSYDIICDTGEFVVNLISEDLTRAMDFCGVKSGRDVNKFEHCHLTPIASQTVSCPSIAESPVCLECKVTQRIELGSHDMFLATVEAVSVDDHYINNEGKFQLNDAHLVAYSHGEYFSLGEQLGTFGYSVRKKPAKKAEPVKKTTKKPAAKKAEPAKKPTKKPPAKKAEPAKKTTKKPPAKKPTKSKKQK